MTEDDITRFVTELPGVAVIKASKENGAPEGAWGDSFFYYDPDGNAADQRLPFATIVISDYEGFDTASNLNRPDVFRLNIAVGRALFQELLGYTPAAHAENSDSTDYSILDELLPHPVYAAQAWVSMLNPDRTMEQAKTLLVAAHDRAVKRHRPSPH